MEVKMKWIQPMEPILKQQLTVGKDWIHQIKWDGIRGISYVEQGKLRLFTKKGNERSSFYPEMKNILQLLDKEQAVLDGELIVLDDGGKPTFERILARERVRSLEKLDYHQRRNPVKYIVFDLLSLNGKDLTKEPLMSRMELLQAHLKQNQSIAITDDFQNGEILFSLMKQKGWEGIVSKKIDSYYFPGKHHQEWYKKKIRRKILTVISGVHWKNNLPNSLLLSVYKQGKYYYIGKAAVGLKQSDFQLLKSYIGDLEQEYSPFNNEIKIKEVTWLIPMLTCWVEFLEWTSDKLLRHPKIIGFSSLPVEEANGKEVIV